MFSKNPKNCRHLRVSLPDKKQDIFIGKDLLDWLINKLSAEEYSSFIVFCDSNIASLHSDLLLKIKEKLKPAEVILVRPEEASKSLEFLNSCLETCIKVNLNRKACLIAIGGGIVGDVAGFLASIYMRGIDMVFIPTTLMSQGDTVINKVAISYKLLKNVVGSFYSPRLTVCDTNFLQSLPEKEVGLGLSEIIKHALIYSRNFTNYLSSTFSLSKDWKNYDWEYIIYKSLKIKARFVQRDPYDRRGIHKGLSYGHTFANALEGLSDFNFRHGEAVALGMRIAGEVSHSLGILRDDDLEVQNSLINAINLPLKFEHNVSHDQIISYLIRDKISMDGKINLVILRKIGKHKIISGVSEEIIKNAITKSLS